MESISEMIGRMCPDGVDMIELEKLCKTITPPLKLKTNQYLEDGQYLVIDQGQNYSAGYTDDEDALVPEGEYVLYGDHTCSVKYISTRFAQGADGLKILKAVDSCIPKYLYYALLTYNLQNTEYKRHWTQAKEILIPLPPISIQQEIVRILDSFTQLQSNLEAELAARQKQYQYYRNKLLTFNENDESVEWKTLGEIGTMHKGKGIQKADFVDEGMPCIHYGQVHTYYGFSATETKSFVSEEMYSNSNKAKKGDLIIATTSEDVEACCKSTVWLGDTEPAISGDAHYYRHDQNPKYIGYLFMTEMFAAQKRTAAVGAKVTRVHGDSILKFKFPIPSIQYQNEVVEKLDNFEALISNIKQELEARRKQYEYYREKLLTFE